MRQALNSQSAIVRNPRTINAAPVIHEHIATTLVPNMMASAFSLLVLSVSFIPLWGWFDIIFTLMVLAGVCGELPWLGRILIPDKPNDLMLVEWHRQKLKKKFEVVLIFGIAGELICLPFSLWESSKLNKEAGDARREAGLANERAAILEATNVFLSGKVEELRKANDELEALTSPRRIEISGPASHLSRFSGMRVAIIVGPESINFGFQLAWVLHGAGWRINENTLTVKALQDGVTVGLCSTNINDWDWLVSRDKSPEHEAALALVDELMNNGIDAEFDTMMDRRTSLRFNGIVIIVGPKPTRVGSQIFQEEYRSGQLDKKMQEATSRAIAGWQMDEKSLAENARLREEYRASQRRLENLRKEQIKKEYPFVATNSSIFIQRSGWDLP